jgi:hypothetical protein
MRMHEPEGLTLEGLGEDVGPHFFSWFVAQINEALKVVVFDKEEFGMNVFCVTSAGCTSIFAEGEGTHVVLINDVRLDIITLGFNEIACPEDAGKFAIKAVKFSFRGASGIDFFV